MSDGSLINEHVRIELKTLDFPLNGNAETLNGAIMSNAIINYLYGWLFKFNKMCQTKRVHSL